MSRKILQHGIKCGTWSAKIGVPSVVHCAENTNTIIFATAAHTTKNMESASTKKEPEMHGVKCKLAAHGENGY